MQSLVTLHLFVYQGTIYFEIYQKVINNIGRLYDVTPKNEILLINSKENLKFLSSIIDLFFFKEQKIINSKPHYRKTLIKLEKELAI